MNKERLEKVIVALQGAPRQGFTMKHFGDCGTPACALGHYASRPDLQSAYRLERGCLIDIERGWAIHYTCVRDHFELTEPMHVHLLFGEEGCNKARSPKQAIAYIRKFIDTNGEMT